MDKTVIILCTSADELPGYGKTGIWLEEAAAPWVILESKGIVAQIASVKGGTVPVDPVSLEQKHLTKYTQAFCENETAMIGLNNSVPIADINLSDYDGIYVVGGHGAMVDLDSNADVRKALETYYEANKAVGLVCHGVAAIAQCTRKVDFGPGEGVKDVPIIQDLQVTGFCNEEEREINAAEKVPYLLEDELKKRGASYTRAANWNAHIVEEGNVITGQNPQSSEEVARHVADFVLNPKPRSYHVMMSPSSAKDAVQ